MMPLFVSVMVACAISRGISSSIYDTILMQKGLPYLPLLRCDRGLTASDLMLPRPVTLSRWSRISDIRHVLETTTFSIIPLIYDTESHMFLGCVTRQGLMTVVNTHENLTTVPDTLSSHSLKTPSPADDVACSPRGNEPGTPTTPMINIMCFSQELETHNSKEITFNCQPHDLTRIDLLSSSDQLTLDRSFMQVDEETPVEQIHLLFEMLKSSVIFISRFGKLQGVISRRSLYFRLHYLNHRNMNIPSSTPITR